MLIVQDTSLRKTYILSITNIFKFIKNSNHFRIINKLITSRVLKLARKFVCCDRAWNWDLKFPIEKRVNRGDRHSRSRKSKNRNSSERGCRSKFASLLIRIILSGLEETWNLLDPLSVWKRLVLFNFRVCRISCNAEYEILGSQTLKDLEFYVRYSRSLLSTVPHSDIWLEIHAYTRTYT